MTVESCIATIQDLVAASLQEKSMQVENADHPFTTSYDACYGFMEMLRTFTGTGDGFMFFV